MRKAELKMGENRKYKIIESLALRDGNKTRAALKLGCSRSSVYRMLEGYRAEGKEYFIHGNCGRKPAHAKSDKDRKRIVNLYNDKYRDASYALFSELLGDIEGICASPSLVRDILMNERILSPFARKKTRRALKKELSQELKSSKKKSERAGIESKIIAIEDAHARRPRSKYFGEMIQMDASIHPWFGDGKSALHIAVDDASSMIVGARFSEQETLAGYYEVFRQILVRHGIPYMFFTDRRTVFEYKRVGESKAENDTFTQFGYACKQLGVELKASSVPQAKGRVERAFGTLQKRLPVILRTAGVSTIEQANAFLDSYVKKHNAKFALQTDNIPSVFETQPKPGETNRILAVVATRKIDAGHVVSFRKKLFLPTNSAGYPVHFRKGTSGLVIETLDKKLFFSVCEKLYSLEEVPERAARSARVDEKTREKPKARYIPPMSHPWRASSFEKFRSRQSHAGNNGTPPSVA